MTTKNNVKAIATVNMEQAIELLKAMGITVEEPKDAPKKAPKKAKEEETKAKAKEEPKKVLELKANKTLYNRGRLVECPEIGTLMADILSYAITHPKADVDTLVSKYTEAYDAVCKVATKKPQDKKVLREVCAVIYNMTYYGFDCEVRDGALKVRGITKEDKDVHTYLKKMGAKFISSKGEWSFFARTKKAETVKAEPKKETKKAEKRTFAC